MKRTFIKDLFDNAPATDTEIAVCGWIKTIRNDKFIELSDGTCFNKLQVVAERENLDNFDEVIHQNVGAALRVKGKFVLTPEAKQPFELLATAIYVEGASTPDFPIQKKAASLEFLREQAYLRPRTNTFNAVFRIRSVLAQAIHRYFADHNFIYVHTPIVTASDCEGAGEMFQITTLDMVNPPLLDNGEIDYSKDFFGKKANLTVSGQLNVETFCMAFSNVYTFGPTFRAENSNTSRHAAEFWMIEPEIAFADLKDNMALVEDLLKFCVRYTMERCPQDIEFLNKFVDKDLVNRLNKMLELKFKEVKYTDAIKILQECGEKFDYPVYWGCDLQSEHERYLTEKHFKRPIFLTDYPKDIKAFYMRMNDDGKTVAAMDLLVPGIGELVGGSQREERLDMLDKRMAELGLKQEDYWWYRNLRIYGGTKHSGFGIGFERLVMYVTGISNIRDVLPFPRTVKNAEF